MAQPSISTKQSSGPLTQPSENQHMETRINLLKGDISYEEAAAFEYNVLPELTYPDKMSDFINYLLVHRREVEDIVSSYLGLTALIYACQSRSSTGKDALVAKCSFDFHCHSKLGEAGFPGNCDEKLRSEVATYAWIGENCPEIPVAHLWGFAFAGGPCFATMNSASLLVRVLETIRRRIWSWFGWAVPCRYLQLERSYRLNVGHMVLDFIERDDAEMLSETWETKRQDVILRANLFRGLSRIMLGLGKIPLPRIGSFTMDNKGFIRLTNRPLNMQLHQLENEGIPTDISRETTYTSVEPFLLDSLACHDNRLRHQPNAVNDEDDCQEQMANLSIFRSMLPLFVRKEFRHGPFVLALTDMHASNIFVDKEWNIKYMIDLEWACSLPIEMLHPPWWLSNEKHEYLSSSFDEVYQEFLEIFGQEEALLASALHNRSRPQLFTDTIRHGWEIGNFFYFLALSSVTGLYFIFQNRIRSRFDAPSDCPDTAPSVYWCLGRKQFVDSKIKDKRNYDDNLKRVFSR